jgi:hypothetical protein
LGPPLPLLWARTRSVTTATTQGRRALLIPRPSHAIRNDGYWAWRRCLLTGLGLKAGEKALIRRRQMYAGGQPMQLATS